MTDNPLKSLPDSEVFQTDYENLPPEYFEDIKGRLRRLVEKNRAAREKKADAS